MIIKRRSILAAALAAIPSRVLAQPGRQAPPLEIGPVRNGADRLGESHTIGASAAAFKVLTTESKGAVFIMENVLTRKGGPPRHLHHDQDEWFYVLQGDFVFEIGSQRFTLGAGDSILGPREIAHAYAFVGEPPGRLLIAFNPANRIEEFFRNRTEGAQYSTDAARYKAYGLELLGGPLQVG
ncbi:MAG TPA: cupin domain-containing protein [Vicinamibacterales bacterium]